MEAVKGSLVDGKKADELHSNEKRSHTRAEREMGKIKSQVLLL
jgi:hypothetical protein